MHDFGIIKDMIYRELDDISNHSNQLNKDCVETIGELVDILKDVGQIEMFEQSSFGYDDRADGYSRDGNGMSGNSYGRYYFDDGRGYMNNSYGNNMGYRRSSGYRGRGYSRDDGKQYMIQELENLMHEASDEHDKQEIRRLVEKMKNS